MTKIEPPIEHVKSYDPFKGLPLDDMFNAGIQVYGITMGDLETIATLVATQDNSYICIYGYVNTRA